MKGMSVSLLCEGDLLRNAWRTLTWEAARKERAKTLF